MTDELCACGHTKSEHGEIIWVKPKKEGGKTETEKGLLVCRDCHLNKIHGKASN